MQLEAVDGRGAVVCGVAGALDAWPDVAPPAATAPGVGEGAELVVGTGATDAAPAVAPPVGEAALPAVDWLADPAGTAPAEGTDPPDPDPETATGEGRDGPEGTAAQARRASTTTTAMLVDAC